MSGTVAHHGRAANAANESVGGTTGTTDRVRWLHGHECLEEVSVGIGAAWRGLPLYGASRDGRSPAKEAIGKHPERYKPVEPGTVFYNPMRILLGSIAMLDEGEPRGITSPDYVVVRGRPGVLHHRVFYYWFRSQGGQQLIRDLARGGVRERILFNRLRAGFIPVLPWRVQVPLAEQLATVPAARKSASDRLAAAEAIPAALLREVFHGEETTEWSAVPLAEVCRCVEGQVDPREPEFGSLPHINGENIASGTGRLYGIRTATEDGLISGKYLFEPGMILYSKLRPYLRKAAIAPSRGVCSADMYPLVFDPLRVDPLFALYSLLAPPFTSYAVDQSRRARMPKLNREQLFAWHLPLPETIQEQQRIARDLSRRLAAGEALIGRCRDELAAIESLPAAFLRAAFAAENTRYA